MYRSHSGSESDVTNAAAAAAGGGGRSNHTPTLIPDNPPLLGMITVPEETITVHLFRTANERLGLSIVGGTDNTDLPQVHVSE